jgi:beta-galactosidase
MRTVPRYSYAEWQVPYAPGVLAARGFVAGQEVVSTERRTTAAPAKISLEADRTTLEADGEDLAVVTVAVQDENGLVVPVAENLVRFTLSGKGKILGVGNGDPSSHEPDKASQRSVFGGLCQVLIQVSDQPGELVLTAEADGLSSARLVLKSEPVVVRSLVALSGVRSLNASEAPL